MFGSWRGLVRHRVVVNCERYALEGILWAQRGPLLVLRDVIIREPGMEPAKADGEIVIERVRVDYIQVVS